MRVISISTDRKIFDQKSDVSNRMKDYATLFEELHIIVFSLSKHNAQKIQIAPNAWVYPTNSFARLLCIFDAYRIAKPLLNSGSFVTTQDPFETGVVGYLLKIFSKGVYLNVQVHTNFLHPNFRRHTFLNTLRFFIAKIVMPKADSIRVVSEQIKKGLLSSGFKLNNEPLVLPVLVPDLSGTGNKRFFGTQILVVSRLEPEKNLPMVLESFAKVAFKNLDAGLVFVGDGTQRPHLEELSEKMGIKKQVKFAGWQNNVADYYLSSDIFILISKYEGYNRSLVEAARAGLAIISTQVSPVGEDLMNEDVCVVKADSREIRDALENLVEKTEYRKSLGQRAQKRIREVQLSKGEYLEKYKKQFYV